MYYISIIITLDEMEDCQIKELLYNKMPGRPLLFPGILLADEFKWLPHNCVGLHKSKKDSLTSYHTLIGSSGVSPTYEHEKVACDCLV